MSFHLHLREQAARVHPSPSDPQKEAGNYRKGHVRLQGLDISVETPKGAYRRGVGEDGKPWQSKVPAHYGYIRRTEGADGDHVDCYIGPHHKSPLVYVVDQRDADSKDWDEHKVMLGFSSPKQARAAYEAGFSDGRGKQRMGHMTEITMAQFKDWLRNGDTTTPYKRQSGGRVPGFAEGGKADDWTQVDDWETTGPAKPDLGKLHALGRGAQEGAAAGFSGEMKAAAAASTLPDIPVRSPVARGLQNVGHTAVGAVRYLMDRPGAREVADKKLAEENEINKTAHEQHPWMYGLGEVGGSVPTMLAVPEAAALRAVQGGSKLVNAIRSSARAALPAGLYGTAHGAGTGEGAERATNAAVEGGAGTLLGALSPAAGWVAGKAHEKITKPIVSTVQGWINPTESAAARIMRAVQADTELILQGKAKGMTPTQWAAAKAAGEPVTIADLGSSNVQALVRSSANTSPEGRAMLEKMIEDRFLTQGERVASDVRGLVAGGANAGKTADQLVAEYDVARGPAYKAAFGKPNAQAMWDADYQQIAQAPPVQQAIRMAAVNAKNEAAKLGLPPPRNPFVMQPGSGVEGPTLTLGTFKDAAGNPTSLTPNLQFWDVVKKNLDAGDRQSQQWAKILRDKLDGQVPEYGQARGIAANFFGERDALQAGRTLAGKTVDPEVVQKMMRQMDPAERELFREGYASDLAGRVIGRIRDTRDITKAIYNTEAERKTIEAIFGPAGTKKIEARMALETFMDGARQAMGNSTTARQLVELGLAGGVVGTAEGAYSSGFNPTAMLTHGLMGAAGAHGLTHYAGPAMAAGARKFSGYVDKTTATYVARLLTSNDPAQLAQGLALAVKNQKIMDGIKSVATRMALGTQTEASSAAPKLLGAVPAHAQDQQPQADWQ